MSRIVGSDALMRVSSLTFPSLTGTLKSTRIRTRLPWRSRSRTESLVIGRLPHLRDHHLRQLRHAAGVAPLVVVPADELEEVLVELDAAARVEDREAADVDEVAGDDLVLGVAQDALEVGLGGLLHRALDLVERRVLH